MDNPWNVAWYAVGAAVLCAAMTWVAVTASNRPDQRIEAIKLDERAVVMIMENGKARVCLVQPRTIVPGALDLPGGDASGQKEPWALQMEADRAAENTRIVLSCSDWD
jgi:hypothetical protein